MSDDVGCFILFETSNTKDPVMIAVECHTNKHLNVRTLLASCSIKNTRHGQAPRSTS